MGLKQGEIRMLTEGQYFLRVSCYLKDHMVFFSMIPLQINYKLGLSGPPMFVALPLRLVQKYNFIAGQMVCSSLFKFKLLLSMSAHQRALLMISSGGGKGPVARRRRGCRVANMSLIVNCLKVFVCIEAFKVAHANF